MRARVTRPDPGNECKTAERCHILEAWNDPSDPGVSIARARVTPGTTTQLHRLLDVAERYPIISGSGTVEVGDPEPEVVGPGDVAVIPPGVPQQISNISNEDLIFYCICTPAFGPASYEALE